MTSDVPSEVVVRPLFVPATKGRVPGGFAMLFNRVFEQGYWARMADVERAVYPALGFAARFSDDFEAEASVGDLVELTGLGRTSVKKAMSGLIERGLIEVVVEGSGRTKSVYRLLVPTKDADDAGQADAAADRRRAKGRAGGVESASGGAAASAAVGSRQTAAEAAELPELPINASGSRSRPPAGHDRNPLRDVVAADPASRSRPPAGRDRGPAGRVTLYLGESTLQEQPQHAADQVVVDLCRLGLKPETASQLADEFEADYLAAYADAYRRNRSEGRRYSAGWLVTAIREGWDVKHLRRPAAAVAAAPRPADPFEAAWRRAAELDDDGFEAARAEAIRRCDDAGQRGKLVAGDRGSPLVLARGRGGAHGRYGEGMTAKLPLVNVLAGSDSSYELSTGNLYPIVGVPWGGTYWSPQTAEDAWFYQRRPGRAAGVLQGVRATHQPSPWMRDWGHFTLMPVVGEVGSEPARWASFVPPRRGAGRAGSVQGAVAPVRHRPGSDGDRAVRVAADRILRRRRRPGGHAAAAERPGDAGRRAGRGLQRQQRQRGVR